jgi:hypothetical protein
MPADPNTWLDLYRRGDREEVWREIVILEDRVREASYIGAAQAVAKETMSRVRANVQAVKERLSAIGYRFQTPERAHVAPSPSRIDWLDAFEERVGVIPISLRAFYDVVGSVDFTQAPDQLVQWAAREGREVDPLFSLGEEDPLVVEELDQDPAPWSSDWWFLACDEFHKAKYSGGENYHVRLPDPAADFPIQGIYGIDEYFVP